ncbi:hypothetical protein [Deinococcus sp.]|uniref:hypothetical protein n=1 Tax=Deinococcus sp. TaxID=47478 RepID=UPI0025D10FD4|nr:hypothetical protein [Deinococcus sp.]
MSITLRSRRGVLFLLPVLTLGLSGCWGSYSSLPSQKEIDVNGNYDGRILGNSNASALLDITLVEKNRDITAVVKSGGNGQTYTLTGTRSVYNTSPVSVNLNGSFGSGSACPGGFAESYSVSARIEYGYDKAANQVLGSGSVERKTCVGGTLTRDTDNSGQIELTKK